MKEFYINSDGIRLHAKLEIPEGKKKYPLMIVVHGLTGHMEEEHIRLAAKAALDEGYAALRVEMYGHGQSEGEFKDHTLFKWINNMLDVYKYVRNMEDVTDISMCGHSQGGLLTILMGGLLGDHLKQIIPMSPAVMIPEDARKGMILGMKFDPDNVPDLMEFYDRQLGGDYLRTVQMIYVEEAIRKYHNRVLIIHGTKDEAVPFSYSVSTVNAYQDARLVAIEDVDHGYTGKVDEMYQAIRDFLK